MLRLKHFLESFVFHIHCYVIPVTGALGPPSPPFLALLAFLLALPWAPCEFLKLLKMRPVVCVYPRFLHAPHGLYTPLVESRSESKIVNCHISAMLHDY